MIILAARDLARSPFKLRGFIRPQVFLDKTPDNDDQFGRLCRFGHMRLEAGFERAYARSRLAKMRSANALHHGARISRVVA